MAPKDVSSVLTLVQLSGKSCKPCRPWRVKVVGWVHTKVIAQLVEL